MKASDRIRKFLKGDWQRDPAALGMFLDKDDLKDLLKEIDEANFPPAIGDGALVGIEHGKEAIKPFSELHYAKDPEAFVGIRKDRIIHRIKRHGGIAYDYQCSCGAMLRDEQARFEHINSTKQPA